VITAEDIKATGASRLEDVLDSVPGLYVKRNLFAFRPQVSIRGAPGTQTLLMVNGAPMRDLVWSNGIFWKGLPASAIERVEIIRGPGSALFGADASAGVINVITKTAAPIAQSEAGLRAGSFDTQEAWVQHGARWNGMEVGVTAELSRTEGHGPWISPDKSLASGSADYAWEGQDVRLSLAGGGWRLLADYMGHGDVATGLTGWARLDPANRSDDSQYSLALLYDRPGLAPGWSFNAALRLRGLAYSSGIGYLKIDGTRELLDVDERQASIEAGGLYTGFDRHALRVGAGYAWDGITEVRQVNPSNPAHPLPEDERGNAFLYVQDVWRVRDGLELTAGLRYDDYNDFGDAVSPRLALVWQGTPRLATKLLYGEAFRAPSYQELYYQAANVPNPNLTPEQSRTWELAFDYLASQDLRLGLSLYHFKRSDVISGASGQFQNLGDFAVRGVEMEAKWRLSPALALSGHLSYRDEDDSPAQDLSVPTQSAYLRLDWAFQPRWRWNLEVNWYGDRPLATGDPRQELGSFSVLDTTLRYRHDRHWEFAATVRNLFDEDRWDYSSKSLVHNLPLPGRNGYVELRYQF
jgi:iron complex outermembrane receptor protein